MLFNSFTYLVFLPLVVALHWLLPERFRRALLLIASYVFYMSWMPAYGALIFGLTVANYLFGLAIAHSRARAVLIASLIFNIGCLCFYKYATFLVNSAWQMAFWSHKWCHLPQTLSSQSPVLNIILPLGISFFTFEFIHYTVDVFRGSPPIRNFFHFALFAAFFPSQIAGPIKRFQDFEQQLASRIRFDAEQFKQGCSLIFLGLFKKMVLGDNLGQVVAVGFSNPHDMGTLDAWLAATAFTIQIYLDFSGYTDIGRGSALMLGYKLPPNFNWPFLSASLNEFWRRWHMSLSTWLRDYLFIPLGGSRVGAWKIKRNLFITMALGGLWHGADWHYAIWGLFHGTGLVLTKDWLDFVDRTPWLNRLRNYKWWHCSGVACTFVFLIFAGVVFRAPNVPKTLEIFGRMFTIAPSAKVVEAFILSTLPVSISVYCCFLALEQLSALPSVQASFIVRPLQSLWQTSIAARAASYAFVGLIILGFAPEHVSPFIYFQF